MVDGHGDVVRHDGQPGLGAQPAEVRGDLARVGAGVEGRGGHQGVGAQCGGGAGVVEDPGGGGVDDPGQDGHPAVRGLDDGLQGGGAPVVGEIGDLAGGAEREQPVDAAVEEVGHQAGEGGGVDLAARVERSADGRDDAAQRCGKCHGGVL